MQKILILGLASSMLYGCAAMSVEECKTANWQQVGMQDASEGKESQLAKYYKACQKANIQPPQRLYEHGYQKGLTYYCQPQIIFNQALKGKGNYQICPLDVRAQLSPYYQAANQYFVAKEEYNRYQRDFDHYNRMIRDKKKDPKDRSSYQKQLDDLQVDASRVNQNYWNAQRNLEHFKYQHQLK